jgi:hypothetical protein
MRTKADRPAAGALPMSDPEPESARAFSFLRLNERPPKPRERGLTEIRGPYYTPVGKRYLQDLLETAGAHVDSLKFAGGSFGSCSTCVTRTGSASPPAASSSTC